MESEDVDKVLMDLVVDGKIDHKGFDEKGDDLFGLNDHGFDYVEKLIASDCSSAAFALNLPLQNKNENGFWKMLLKIADARRKYFPE